MINFKNINHKTINKLFLKRILISSVLFLSFFLSYSLIQSANAAEDPLVFPEFQIRNAATDESVYIVFTNEEDDLAKLNDPDLFNGNGLKSKYRIKTSVTQEDFDFLIDTNSKVKTSDESKIDNNYGKYYEVASSSSIDILPRSEYTIVTKGGLLKKSQTVKFIFTNENTLIVDPSSDFEEKNNAPKIDFDESRSIRNTNPFDLYLRIPIKLKQEHIDTKPEVKKEANNKTYIANTKILYEEDKIVTAHLRVTSSSITFDPGLDDPNYINSDEEAIKNQQEENQKKEKDIDPTLLKEINFKGGGLVDVGNEDFKGISSERNLENFIVSITNFILGFVAALAIIMMIYGGYLWIIDTGDDQQAEKSRKIIANAVIGLIIIISAYTIVNTVISLEGNTYDGCGAGFEVGNGLDGNYDCQMEGGPGSGIGALAGSWLGGMVGGDTGSVIGGLLGGVGGGLLGQ